eukprot:4363738-Amphidinium_carterae.2
MQKATKTVTEARACKLHYTPKSCLALIDNGTGKLASGSGSRLQPFDWIRNVGRELESLEARAQAGGEAILPNMTRVQSILLVRDSEKASLATTALSTLQRRLRFAAVAPVHL